MREVSLFCALSAFCLHFPLSVACLFSALHWELLESRNLLLNIFVFQKVHSFFPHCSFLVKSVKALLSASQSTDSTVPSADFFNCGSGSSFAVCWPRCNSPLPLIQKQLVGGYYFLLLPHFLLHFPSQNDLLATFI